MTGFHDQAERTKRLLAVTPSWQRVLELRPDIDPEFVGMILDQAAEFAQNVIAPLNVQADRIGCRFENGRVITPNAYKSAYKQLAETGWIAPDLPESRGGIDLPLTLQSACQSLFDRACPAFMMAAGASRAAAHLLVEAADPSIANQWVPQMVSGDWTATICISEPDAGSDVGRIRTKANKTAEGWHITGNKCWISFGDHDMSDRIGHCLLARTSGAVGTRGLSLFLVPNILDDGSSNGITVTGVEEKLGLHGSPTCGLAFDNSYAIPLGIEGRGLPALFTMIEQMRLQTGGQGLGIASGARDVALEYAAERKQGGDPAVPAIPINQHSDVQRQLLSIDTRTETLRAAIIELAARMDIAKIAPDEDEREKAAMLAAWMLPLIKNFGGDTGFSVANDAIQVLGGAGYTRDFPVEQAMRDARILTIYEGTTGMQALDFLTRRLWRDDGAGMQHFLDTARAEIDHPAFDQFEALSIKLLKTRNIADANSYLLAGWAAIKAWMSVRHVCSNAA